MKFKSIEINKPRKKGKYLDYVEIPTSSNNEVLKLAAPHIESFNYFLGEGLRKSVECLPKLQFALPNGDRVSLFFSDASVGNPIVDSTSLDSVHLNLYPRECVESGSTYAAPFNVSLNWSINDKHCSPITCNLGDIPIMVKSKNCHLYNMTPKQLVEHGELVNETGGYFIINGSCKVLRMLIANRRNYPIALIRNSWKQRDTNISEKGILIRCVTSDQTSIVNILHHMATGGVKVEFSFGYNIFLMPLILLLKILMNYSDRFIYLCLVRGREEDAYYSEKIKMMMRELQENNLCSQAECKDYLGKTFRHKLTKVIPDWLSNDNVADYLIDNFLLIHLSTLKFKFDTLCMMTRKLFAFVAGECIAESEDSISMQEVTLGGHVYLQLVKEKLLSSLSAVKYRILLKCKEVGLNYSPNEVDLRNMMKRLRSIVGETMKQFLSTGSMPKGVKCGLMQTTGFSIVMEHLNRMRDLSHLRAIHRGSFFLEMKTVNPRRLTGEAWGFICPVHTPDGAPCGLLNHLTYSCVIPNEEEKQEKFICMKEILLSLGMTPMDAEPLQLYNNCVEVIWDGGLVGYVSKSQIRQFVEHLRTLKIQNRSVCKYTEIIYIEERDPPGQYPGLFLVTSVARMMRPVINLSTKMVEFIGTLEQNYLNVAVSQDDFDEEVHTHMEIEKTSMLSNIAKLVPFSDCNPNPRNMYQCQMGKQTMGTPIHNWRTQTTSKLYRLNYPQIPLVRNSHYDTIQMDEFCMGFNAVLAVVSYTGYDMEDAMVINKCAMERGLAHGQVYKSEFVDLRKNKKNRFKNEIFQRDPSNPKLLEFLDENGLPYPGTKLTDGDPYFCVYEMDQETYRVMKYKGEDCCVDKYTIIYGGNAKQSLGIQRVNIAIRIRRDPIVGDKFASRSGQKGIMSRLYPMEDLPFSERGISPDIIFNPHGIPSRMTAGTLIDILAGKCAAEFGTCFDSTPFEFSDKNPAFDYFGKMLEKAGFNYFGEDVLYSGIDGRQMEVKIFQGVIYYQRLRHMTADKWQVRSTGPMDNLTHQPVKGRKRGGAIRFGEMERDCLIAHGASFTLKDRLLDCSDDVVEWVCAKCGSMLSPVHIAGGHKQREPTCSICGSNGEMRQLHVPYAFKFLIAELSAVNISVKLGVKSADQIMDAKDMKPKVVPC